MFVSGWCTGNIREPFSTFLPESRNKSHFENLQLLNAIVHLMHVYFYCTVLSNLVNKDVPKFDYELLY